MEKYSIYKHELGVPCLNSKKSKQCYGILCSTSDLSSSSNEIDIEVDQILDYLRDSYAVDMSQNFHYEFQASSNVLQGSGKIKFAKTRVSEDFDRDSLEFKLLCNVEKLDCDGKMKISPVNLEAYTILQNSLVDADKWVD